MSILIIDSGSYSVKFVEGKFLRKNFKIDSFDEVLLSDIRTPSDLEVSDLEIQQRIIREFLQERKFTGKVIYQISNDFLTTRYLELPVANEKKAELMIPFQLDEDLPFAANEAHYTAWFSKTTNNNLNAIVQITEKESFEHLYNSMKSNHTLPSSLISELGVFQSYIEERKFGGHVCIIDIGHKTTKAYFAFNDQILSNHIASTAGSTIDEVLVSTYDINYDEARLYKHENAFFLTEGQLEHVTAEQREFAVIMKQAISPLTTQIQRWLLGYRIKTGFSIEKIYITGGSANLKNIDTFLTEKLEVPVERLKITSLEQISSPTESQGLTLAYLMGNTQKNKKLPSNFLVKSYASGLINGVKLDETIFSFYRMAIVVGIICLGISLESFYFLENTRKDLNADIKKILKDGDLEIPANIQNTLNKNPSSILKYLTTKEKVVTSDLNILNQAVADNAIKPLAVLSKGIRRNDKVSLVAIDSKDGVTSAKFKGESDRDIEQVKELIKNLNLDGLNIKDSNNKLDLELSFNHGNLDD